MKKKFISVIFIATILVSCNKFLDTKPEVVLTPQQAYQTPAEITSALAGVYTNLKTTNFYGQYYASWYTVATDESYFYNTSFPFTYYANNSSDNTSGNTAGFWKGCYQSINYANTLLDNIDASAAIGHVDTAIVRKAKGETYFLRGYYYFLLAQWFGAVPMPIHATSDPTLVSIPRTPLLQVYNQIIADMTVADSLLYDQTFAKLGYSDRVTQEAVEGILARVCLYAAGQPNNDTRRYNDVIFWANKLINAGSHNLLPSYPQVFIDECQNNYNQENIWEIGFNEKGVGIPSSGGTVGVYCGVSNTAASSTNTVTGSAYDSGYCYGYVKLHPRLYCSYQSGDYRRNWNCSNYSFSSGVRTPLANNKYWSRAPAKWRREYEPQISRSTQVTSSTNFPVLRYADVLLMLAEAVNEVPSYPNGDAIKYNAINKVRERSISSTSIIDSLSITNQGSGYTSVPTVVVSGGASIKATVSSGKVSLLLVNQGSGFTTKPTVTIGNQWAAGTLDTVGMQVAAPNGKLYNVIVAGTTTSTPPTNTSGSSSAATTGAVFFYVGVAAQATVYLSPAQNPDLTTGLSQTDFRTAIQMERYHELAFEGLRLPDLRRWGLLIPTVQGMALDINGNNPTYPQIPSVISELGAGTDAVPLTPTQNIGAKDMYWPIPLYDLSLDNLLTQNPGY